MTKREEKAKAEKEALEAVLKKAAPRCTPDTESKCQGMTYALHFAGERRGGLEVGFTFNVKSGESTGAAFIYRTMKGDKVLFLRHCPFCGASVVAPTPENR